MFSTNLRAEEQKEESFLLQELRSVASTWLTAGVCCGAASPSFLLCALSLSSVSSSYFHILTPPIPPPPPLAGGSELSITLLQLPPPSSPFWGFSTSSLFGWAVFSSYRKWRRSEVKQLHREKHSWLVGWCIQHTAAQITCYLLRDFFFPAIIIQTPKLLFTF